MLSKLQFQNIHFIPGANNGRYPFCHSLFIDDSRKAIIDPASDEAALKKIRDQAGVDYIILSHYHEDHWLHLNLFEDAELWMPVDDAPPFGDLDLFMDWYGMTDPHEIAEWKLIIRNQFHFRERIPDRVFEDGERLMIGQTRIRVLQTPGHTPGHSCFFFPDHELLYLADIDLTRFGPWYGDKYSDIDTFIASVERMRRIPAKVLITAHEDGVIEGAPGELWDSYLKVIEEREDRLREFIREPHTIEEIVEARLVYGRPREPRTFYDFGERATMRKHLERMIKKGEAERREGRYRYLPR